MGRAGVPVTSAMYRAQIRYDAREPAYRDLGEDRETAIGAASDYDADQRARWLADHDLDLYEDGYADLVRGWAAAHGAGVQVDGRRLRTLYRARGYQVRA